MRKSRGMNPAAVFLLFALLASFIISSASCGTPAFKPEVEKEMSDVISGMMSEFNIPGAIAGVWVEGRGEWVRAFGESDTKNKKAMELPDKFRIGSNTKTFTVTLVLQLVDEGKIKLEDRLSGYIDGVPSGDQITIQMLCNNTSGLFEYGEDETVLNKITTDPHYKWKPRELVDIAISHPPYFPPGEGWRYSNTNFILLGMIIEKVAGKELGTVCRKNIFEPLGLANTNFPDSPEIKGEYSHGYGDSEENPDQLDDYTDFLDPSIWWSGGAIISNLDDLKTWTEALVSGDLISDSSRKEMLDWVSIPGEEEYGTKYGLGVLSLGGFIGHNGRTPGYESCIMYDPEKEAMIIIFFNKSAEGSYDLAAFMKIAKVLFPDDVPW
ncbi:MAG: beta-lactamase family protein [Actinobacteria bacterium]|nr:beta-lactamase family protein [Actinomycetota bacterium]